MKISITGALGHIGSRVIRELPTHFPNCEIVMIDNMMTQRFCSLFNLPNNALYRFIEMDVAQSNLADIIDGSEVVIHLAAITDAAGSFENKERVEHNNYHATKNLAEAVIRTGSAMIHLSSTSVYGTQNTVVDEKCDVAELRPQSPYAETKLKEEKLLFDLAKNHGLRYTTYRFGTICGTSPGMRFHTAVNKFCWQSVMGVPLTVWKTALDQKRPYLTIDDAVAAFVHAIQSDLFDGSVYNVLTDNLTVRSLIDMIKVHIHNVEIKFVDSKIMNQLSYEVECQRFRDTGFSFNGLIGESIKETIQLLQNANQKSD